jgi:two-component system CheB/CheR fusion protein
VLSRDITHRVAAEAVLRRRNDELERFNRTAVDRELRMVELKQEVNRLALAAGRPAPYDTSFAAPIVDPASS